MATGLEMLDALKSATRDLPAHSEFAVNPFDKLDLCKLTVADLLQRGFDTAIAERVVEDLNRQSVAALGTHLGLELKVDKKAPNLIPGEGLKRTAGALKDDPETLEEMLDFLDRLRHPTRQAS
jgi:hypothetical protein